jgi:hypothetical protein
MVVGLYSNKLHELCCSHLFCRLSIFYHIKVPQVMKAHHCEELVKTIETDISFAIFRVLEIKSLMDTTRKILEDSRTITK